MAQMGELYFQLGLKGGEKTLETLGNMRKGVNDLASTSLSAKAALAGVVYMFGSLLGQSAQFGQNVSTMSSILGISTKDLQQFEQAGLKAGVAIDTMDAAIKSVFAKKQLTDITGQFPDMFEYLNRQVGIDKEAWKNPATNFATTVDALKRLYQRTDIDPSVKKQTAESMGISDYSLLQAIQRNKLSPEIVGRQPFKSSGAIEELNKISAKLKEIKAEINNTFNDWSAKHGVKLLDDFHKLEISFLNMVTAMSVLVDKLHVFEIISKAMEGWTQFFTLFGDLIDRITGKEKKDSLLHKFDEGAQARVEQLGGWVNFGVQKVSEEISTAKNLKDNTVSSVGGFVGSIVGAVSDKVSEFKNNPWTYPFNNNNNSNNNPAPILDLMNDSMIDFLRRSAEPQMNVSQNVPATSQQQVVVNQDINFNHDGRDFQRTANSMKDATVQASQAWRFNPAHLRLT